MRNARLFAVPFAAATLLVSAGPAWAAPAEVIKEDVPVSFLTNSCNGEDVILAGTFRTVLKTNRDGSVSQQAMVRLTGTGSSGTVYVVNQPLHATLSDTVFEVDSIAVLVSQGAQPNELARFHLHTDPSLDTVEILCRG